MSKCVVYFFEAVDIDLHDAKITRFMFGPLCQTSKSLIGISPVAQSGQRVVQREPFHFSVGVFKVRNIRLNHLCLLFISLSESAALNHMKAKAFEGGTKFVETKNTFRENDGLFQITSRKS